MQSSHFDLVPARDWETWSTEHDAVIIDVREPAEWARGVLPGSELIPLETLPEHMNDLDKDRAILFVCRTGEPFRCRCPLLRYERVHQGRKPHRGAGRPGDGLGGC